MAEGGYDSDDELDLANTMEDLNVGGAAGPVYGPAERMEPQWNRPTDPVYSTPDARPVVYVAPRPARLQGRHAVIQPAEHEQRLMPTYTSGFPTMPSQLEFQRSRAALSADLYPEARNMTPLNPSYRVGTPEDIVRRGDLWRQRSNTSLFVDGVETGETDEDNSESATPRRKPRDTQISNLSLVPFYHSENLARRTAKAHRKYYLPATSYRQSHTAPRSVQDYAADEGGLDLVYDILTALDGVQRNIEYVMSNFRCDDSMDRLREVYLGLEQFLRLYNRVVYGVHLPLIFKLCIDMSEMRQTMANPETHRMMIFYQLQRFKSLNDLLISKMKDIKDDCQKHPKMRHSLKKHWERLEADPPHTGWQTQDLEAIEDYMLLYIQSGKVGYQLFDKPSDNIPSMEYLRARGLGPSQWIQRQLSMESLPRLHSRRLVARSPERDQRIERENCDRRRRRRDQAPGPSPDVD